MRRFWEGTTAAIWTSNLILLASGVFLLRFGEGLMGGVRTNFFVDTLGLSGGQVLWLEGIRELPGLGLIFIAALTMHLPLSRRAAASVLLMGVGFIFRFVSSLYQHLQREPRYTAALEIAAAAGHDHLQPGRERSSV